MLFLNKSQLIIEDSVGLTPKKGPHLHPYIEFDYLYSGKTAYSIWNKSFKLDKGDLICIPSNTIHNASSRDNGKRKRILIHINEDFIREIFDEEPFFLLKPCCIHIGNDEQILKIIERIIEEKNNINNDRYIDILLCEFLILLSRKANVNIFIDEQKIVSNKILEILNYINENYSQELSLKQIANTFYLNTSYLSRMFKENTGINFVTYLNKYRISQAVNMLLDTNKSITQIATLCGFNSTNNFCKVFKAILGESPLNYKKSRIN